MVLVFGGFSNLADPFLIAIGHFPVDLVGFVTALDEGCCIEGG